MAIAFAYTESTNTVVVTGGTSGTPATFADFVHGDRTVATTACTVASGAELLAALTCTTGHVFTYPIRPVEFKALRLAFTLAGTSAGAGDTIDIYGTTAIWCKMSGASASGQKVVPCADLTHLFQVGDTVRLIDISAPATTETDVVAAITEGVSITLTNNNTNSYATGDIVGIDLSSETIDVSGGDATYWSANSYGQIAYFDCTGWADGTVKVDQPIWGVIWDLGNTSYIIDATFDIGNDSTSSYFAHTEGYADFGDTSPRVLDNAVLTLGTPSNEYAGNSVYWRLQGDAYSRRFIDDGTLNLYNATIIFHSNTLVIDIDFNVVTWVRVTIRSEDNREVTIDRLAGTITDLYAVDVRRFGIWRSVPEDVTFNNIHSESTPATSEGFFVYGAATNVVSNLLVTNNAGFDVATQNGANLELVDPLWHPTSIDIGDAEKYVSEQYTCNITVCDKDGTLLDDVTVVCDDQADAEQFSELTGATNTGKIDEQILTYKTWTGTSETLVTSSPHKFTLSKAGYETMVLENITVDGPINWHLELQPLPYPVDAWRQDV